MNAALNAISFPTPVIPATFHKLKSKRLLRLYSLLLQFRLCKHSCLDALLLVVAEGKLRESANSLTLEVEHIGNGTTGQSEESEKGAGPLVAQTVVHLLCEQDGRSTPHGTKEGLCCESGCRLVLIGIHWKIISNASNRRLCAYTYRGSCWLSCTRR